MTLQRPDFSRRIPELDGLRGVAILMVLIYHWFIVAGNVPQGVIPHKLLAAGTLGWSGVDLFFVLSGFLIGGILLDARGKANYYKAFYLRRFYRIVPIYAVVCLLFWICFFLPISKLVPPFSWLFGATLPWHSYLTFTQNFWMAWNDTMGSRIIDATWSLAVEEQFYLTLPFIVSFAKRKHLAYIVILAIVGAPLLRIFIQSTYAGGAIATYVLTPCRADTLMMGVAAALLVRNQTTWSFLVIHKRLLFLTFGFLLLGVVYLTLKQWDFASFPMASIGYSWMGMFYFTVLLIAVVHPASFLSGILRNRALAEVGTLAYGLYLFHQPILGLVHGLLRSDTPYLTSIGSVGVTSLAFLIIFLIAKLSWIYFEQPLVKRGHKYKYDEDQTHKICSTNIGSDAVIVR